MKQPKLLRWLSVAFLTVVLIFLLRMLWSNVKQPVPLMLDDVSKTEQSSDSGDSVERPLETEDTSDDEGTATGGNSVIGQAHQYALAPESAPDAQTSLKVQQYVESLASQGFSSAAQGLWMQSDGVLLASYQGTVPLPAASLTKVATTLASLEVLGVEYEFTTSLATNGSVEGDRLNGDLYIIGSADPFFVWEEAITIGNLLNQRGISSVTGDLIVVGDFYMNFQQNSLTSGNLLKESLDSTIWTGEAENQYQTMPPGTPRPRTHVRGTVRSETEFPADLQPILLHKSFPLVELLKKMNQYSNNVMAEMLAEATGGAEAVSTMAAMLAGVPSNEISLINGSGLGVENKISPRAVCAMFLAIDNFLQPYDLTISDVFTVIGRGPSVLESRPLPSLSVVKSGSLSQASAIAGALPTQSKGVVWFSIINGGDNLTGFRKSQEDFLNALSYDWGLAKSLPLTLEVNGSRQTKTNRNEILK